MLIKAKALKGYSLKSLDGDIGSAIEFFFDDQYWAVRYLVANTATWLSGRKVLISPYSLDGVNTAEEKIFVLLNRKQIEESPSIDTDEPVSRQFEKSYNEYYGYPDYWSGPYMWGGYSCLSRDRTRWGSTASDPVGGDRHLRSTHEVTVLIPPKWIQNVSWEEREVAIGLSREAIKAAPEYTDESLLTRDYETGLHGHYNREGYWVEKIAAV